MYVALPSINYDGLGLASVPFDSSRECGELSYIPLESADKTAIYNLIQPVSSTVNGQLDADPVYRWSQ